MTGERETTARSSKSATATGSGGPATSDEQAALTSLFADSSAASTAADAETLRRAREIAARLALRRPRREAAARRWESMAGIPAQGLTNVAFPLQVAARELARIPARDARVLLLSDCVHPRRRYVP